MARTIIDVVIPSNNHQQQASKQQTSKQQPQISGAVTLMKLLKVILTCLAVGQKLGRRNEIPKQTTQGRMKKQQTNETTKQQATTHFDCCYNK